MTVLVVVFPSFVSVVTVFLVSVLDPSAKKNQWTVWPKLRFSDSHWSLQQIKWIISHFVHQTPSHFFLQWFESQIRTLHKQSSISTVIFWNQACMQGAILYRKKVNTKQSNAFPCHPRQRKTPKRAQELQISKQRKILPSKCIVLQKNLRILKK